MHAGLMFVFVCVCDGVALVASVAIGDQLDYRREGRGDGVGVVIGSCSYIFLFKCALNRYKLSFYDADLIVAFFVIAVRSASMVSLTEILLNLFGIL